MLQVAVNKRAMCVMVVQFLLLHESELATFHLLFHAVVCLFLIVRMLRLILTVDMGTSGAENKIINY